MFFQTKYFFKFLLSSTNKHSVHSPFVYDFMTKCVEPKVNTLFSIAFKQFKKELITNNTVIKIDDFGAGSHQLNKNSRSVKAIAKNAGISNKNATLLYKLVNYFKCKNILEIGTSVGLSTFCLANNNETKVTTLEGCKNTLKIAKKYLEKQKLNNINYIQGNFNTTLAEVIKNQKYDLIYFDGNHQKNPTINYFEQCLKAIHNDSVFIFDDIYWSKEMLEAWNYIKKHKRVSLTIDTFYWGIVFFRKEQFEKEHFILRV